MSTLEAPTAAAKKVVAVEQAVEQAVAEQARAEQVSKVGEQVGAVVTLGAVPAAEMAEEDVGI